MSRCYVVTGSAAGIGRATADLLRERGFTVIGVDVHDADIIADLGTSDGRRHLATAVGDLSSGAIDAIVAVAGVAVISPLTVAVNYFGMVATLEELRPLLAGSPAPRAVAVSSMVSVTAVDAGLVESMTLMDEGAAQGRAAELSEDTHQAHLVYSSTKKALAQWVRRNAPSPEWAGAGIPLNAIAPGVILTAMSAPLMASPDGLSRLRERLPMPLNGFAEPIVPARLLAWLVSEENTHVCGQVVFVDGGSDALVRGDSVW